MIKIRRIAALGMIVALIAVGSAAGVGDKPQTYTAIFDAGGEVSFRMSAAGAYVNHISIDGITAECRLGSGALIYDIFGRTPIRDDRSFAVRSRDGKAKAFVKGRFSSDHESVKGAARVHGKIFPGKPRCDSEKQNFKGNVNR